MGCIPTLFPKGKKMSKGLKEKLLELIPTEEEKTKAWDIIRSQFMELILDPDEHPVIWDEAGVLRFQPVELIQTMQCSGALDMNVFIERVSEDKARKALKCTGYSLHHYFQLECVQEWVREVNGFEQSLPSNNKKRKIRRGVL
jgi:hypothetical protein